jgi:DNA-binding NtrC family response regulator
MAKILIVDGFPYVRKLLKEALLEEGHVVSGTGTPERIMERVARVRPDLVLLDLYLNGQDRWDLLLDLKELAPDLPVVVVTGHDGYRKDPRIAHADGFVVKRIDLSDIKGTVFKVLSERPCAPAADKAKKPRRAKPSAE